MRKTIIINENTKNLLKEESEMTEYKFNGSIRRFLRDLLQDPVKTQPNTLLTVNGINRGKLLRLLLKKNMIERSQSIIDHDSDGNTRTAKMKISFKVPKQDFDKKLKRLYIELFEKNVPIKKEKETDKDSEKNIIDGNDVFNAIVNTVCDCIDECTAGGCCSGCGGAMMGNGTGATTASSVSDGNFSNFGFLQPLSEPQRREIIGGVSTKKKKKKK